MKIFKINFNRRVTNLLLSAAACLVGLPLWEALVWLFWASSYLGTGIAIGLAITIGLALIGGAVGLLVWTFHEPKDHFSRKGVFRVMHRIDYWRHGGQADHYREPRAGAPNSEWAIWSIICLGRGTDFWFGARKRILLLGFKEVEAMKICLGLETLVKYGLVEIHGEWRSNPDEWIYLPTQKFFDELPEYQKRNEDKTI